MLYSYSSKALYIHIGDTCNVRHTYDDEVRGVHVQYIYIQYCGRSHYICQTPNDRMGIQTCNISVTSPVTYHYPWEKTWCCKDFLWTYLLINLNYIHVFFTNLFSFKMPLRSTYIHCFLQIPELLAIKQNCIETGSHPIIFYFIC